MHCLTDTGFRKRTVRLRISRLLIVILSVTVFCFSGAAAEGDGNANTIPETTYTTLTGYNNVRVLYSPEMLTGNSCTGTIDPDIAKLAVVLADAAYHEESIIRMLQGMGCTNDMNDYESYAYVDSSNMTLEDNDHAAYYIAHTVYDKYNLYFVPIKGTSSNMEWFSDFHLHRTEADTDVESGNFHVGFYKPAERIYNNLVSRLEGTSNNIVLLTGHSRGAAISNMVAGFLQDNNKIDPCHLFCYNFATPAVGKNLTAYNNIFNFNNRGDVITLLPYWDYMRYGIDIPIGPFAGDANKADYTAFFDLVLPEESIYEDLHFAFDILSDSIIDNKNYTDEQFKAHLKNRYSVEMEIHSVSQLVDDATSAAEIIGKIHDATSESERLLDQCNELKDMAGDYEWEDPKVQDLVEGINTGLEKIGLTPISGYESLDETISILRSRTTMQASINTFFTLYTAGKHNFLAPVWHGHEPATYVSYINNTYCGYMAHISDTSITGNDFPGILANAGKTIGPAAFAGCTGIQHLEIPDGILAIGDAAFNNATVMETLVIPDTVEYLGDNAFGNMIGLKKLTLPVELMLHKTAFTRTVNVEEMTVTAGRTGIMEDLSSSSNEVLPFICGHTLTKVILEEGITNIGDNAFYRGSWNYTGSESFEINFPTTLTRIGKNAFREHKLPSRLDLPEGLTELGTCAFMQAEGVTEINIPFTLKDIPDYAFCKISDVSALVIPDTVENLGTSSFGGMTGLKKLTLPVEHVLSTTAFYVDNSSEQTKNIETLTVTAGRTGIMEDLSASSNTVLPFICGRTLTKVILEEGITNIGDNAFYKGSWNYTGSESFEINLPSTLTRIGKNAFREHKLPGELVLPEGLTELGSCAFMQAEGVTEISIPSTLKDIPNCAFLMLSDVSELVIPDTVETLGISSFGCMTGLKDLTIPVEHILNTTAFYTEKSVSGTTEQTENVETLTITAGRTGIMEDLSTSSTKTLPYLCRNTISEVILEEGITNIGDNAFNTGSGSSTGPENFEINLPSTLTRIGNNAFRWHRMTCELVLPEGLTELGSYAFFDTEKVTEISIPSTLTAIPDYAFCKNTEVSALVIPDTVETLGTSSFGGMSGLKDLTVPVEHVLSTTAFYVDNSSEQTKNIETLTVTAGRTGVMGDLSAYSNTVLPVISGRTLTKVILEEGITNIGDYAFYDSNEVTSGLESFEINLPSTLTRIGKYAFRWHIMPGELMLPEGLTELGSGAFMQAKGVTGISIPSTLKNIPNQAFFMLSDVTTLVIPDTVETLGISSFGLMTGLKNLTVPVEHVLSSTAFYTERSISGTTEQTGYVETLTVTAGRTGIMEDLSGTSNRILPYLCRNTLTQINLEEGITNIGDFAFNIMSGGIASVINMPSTITHIGRYAFKNKMITGTFIAGPDVETIGNSAFSNIGNPVTVYPYSYALDYVKQNSISHLVVEYATMILPEELNLLEEECLAGTAAEIIVLPETNVSVAGSAFANSALRVLVVPGDLSSVEPSAFDGCARITIACHHGSSIDQWAQDHQIKVYYLSE